MKYLLIISIIFLSSDSIIVDTTYTANNQPNCDYIHKQNRQCLKELDIKWAEIEKLIKEKINNNK